MENIFFGNMCIPFLKLLQIKRVENLEIHTDSPVNAEILSGYAIVSWISGECFSSMECLDRNRFLSSKYSVRFLSLPFFTRMSHCCLERTLSCVLQSGWEVHFIWFFSLKFYPLRTAWKCKGNSREVKILFNPFLVCGQSYLSWIIPCGFISVSSVICCTVPCLLYLSSHADVF